MGVEKLTAFPSPTGDIHGYFTFHRPAARHQRWRAHPPMTELRALGADLAWGAVAVRSGFITPAGLVVPSCRVRP